MKKIILILILIPLFSISQNIENNGTLFYKNFEPETYNVGTQNWDACQTNEGIILIANNSGVLTYDGINWKVLNTNPYVRKIKKDSLGRIFVGFKDDFGFLNLDEFGNFKYYSLKPCLPANEEVYDIWNIVFFNGLTFFQGHDKIYQFNEKGLMKIWESKTPNYLLFNINNNLFLTLRNGQIFKFNNDKFALQKIKNMKGKISTMLPFDENKIICTHSTEGLALIQPSTDKNFDWEIQFNFMPKITNQFFKENVIYSFLKISNNLFAYGSTNKGLIIIDNIGNIITQFDKKSGALDNNIWAIYLDNQNGLWLSCNNGISRLEISSYLKYWNNTEYFDGIVNRIIKFENQIYFSTSSGIWKFDNKNFTQIGDLKIQVFDLEIFKYNNNKDSLIIASTNKGIYEIKNNKLNSIKKIYSVFNSKSLQYTPNTLIYSSIEGVGLLEYKQNKWIDKGNIKNLKTEVYGIIENHTGNLWTYNRNKGIIYLKKDSINNFEINRIFDSIDGKSVINEFISINFINDSLIVNLVENNYLINEKNDTFFIKLNYKNFFPKSIVDIFQGSKNDTTFFIYSTKNDFSKQLYLLIKAKDKSYEIDTSIFYRLKNYNIYGILIDQDKFWIGGSKGLYLIDYLKAKNNKRINKCLITKVTNAKDSLISGTLNTLQKVEISYNDNTLHFNFSNLSFNNSENNLFSYKLEGLDDNWSQWSSINNKEYTNLSPGIYIFKVKSKNTYGEISNEASFTFKILYPWYRSIWAYLIYLFLFFGLMYVFGKLLLIRSKRKNKRLEKIIKERTQEIVLKKNEIERKSSELAQQKEEIRAQRDELDKTNKDLELKVLERTRQLEIKNKELLRKQEELQVAYNQLKAIEKIKSDFLTSISHELKTPLTSIVGFSNLTQKGFEKIVAEVWDKIEDVKLRRHISRMGENIDIVMKESEVLSDLINDVLTMSRLKAGFMEWKDQTYLANELLDEVVEMSKEFFINNNYVTFTTDYPKDLGKIHIDKEKFIQLLNNIISNSIKFTHNGTIKLKAYINYRSLCIDIEDTGVGIPKDQINKVFESFTQIGDTLTEKPKGIGLGLAICKEIVNYYQGKISLKSRLGKGSICHIELPLL